MLDAPLVYRDGEVASSFEDNLKRHLHDLSIFLVSSSSRVIETG